MAMSILTSLMSLVWVFVLLLFMAYLFSLFRGNSIAVMEELAADRERLWATETTALQGTIRKQARTIQKLQLSAGMVDLG